MYSANGTNYDPQNIFVYRMIGPMYLKYGRGKILGERCATVEFLLRGYLKRHVLKKIGLNVKI